MIIFHIIGKNGCAANTSKLSLLMRTIEQIKGTIATVKSYLHVMNCVGLERGNCSANAASRWILEAKIHSYKLYTQSFLSLLMENGWVSDEVSICSCTAYSYYLCSFNKFSKCCSKH